MHMINLYIHVYAMNSLLRIPATTLLFFLTNLLLIFFFCTLVSKLYDTYAYALYVPLSNISQYDLLILFLASQTTVCYAQSYDGHSSLILKNLGYSDYVNKCNIRYIYSDASKCQAKNTSIKKV